MWKQRQISKRWTSFNQHLPSQFTAINYLHISHQDGGWGVSGGCADIGVGYRDDMPPRWDCGWIHQHLSQTRIITPPSKRASKTHKVAKWSGIIYLSLTITWLSAPMSPDVLVFTALMFHESWNNLFLPQKQNFCDANARTGGMLVLQAQPADFWEYSIWRGSEIKGNVKCAGEAVWNG